MIVIVDYGMGNLASIRNMFKKIGVKATVESDPDKLYYASKLLLPGVGAFDAAMQHIEDKQLSEVLIHKAVKEQVPTLGICLGMQLLTTQSAEGNRKGFGWIPAETLAFKTHLDQTCKVPHMGWNVVHKQGVCPLLEGFEKQQEIRFYFVHSYFVRCQNRKHAVASTHYGLDFDAVIQKDNVYGMQFHPEKSHRFGMQVFKNFAGL